MTIISWCGKCLDAPATHITQHPTSRTDTRRECVHCYNTRIIMERLTAAMNQPTREPQQ